MKDCRRSLLLDDVSQLVRQQACSLSCPGRVFSGAEHDVPAQGEGPCVDTAGESGRAGIRVDSYRSEVVPEPRFEEGARRFRERRSASGEVPDFRGDTTVNLPRAGLRRLRGPAEVRRSLGRQARTLLHHLVGHAVCLMLERVVDRSDDELRLDERGWRLSRRRSCPPTCLQDLFEIGHGSALEPGVR